MNELTGTFTRQAMSKYWKEKVELHTFLDLDTRRLSASCPGRFTPTEKALDNPLNKGMDGSRILSVLEKQKQKNRPCRESNAGRPAHSLRLYTGDSTYGV
jgi:hypothetical protein